MIKKKYDIWKNDKKIIQKNYIFGQRVQLDDWLRFA